MPLKVGTVLPALDGATHWLGTPGLSSTNLPVHHGGVVVHFWAMSCPACKANMRGLRALRVEFEPRGVVFIAVHMPRGPFDLDVDRVRAAAAEIGITEPCALDNDHAIGDLFEMGGKWPTYFVFDGSSRLKRRAVGGLGLRLCELALRDLFGGRPASPVADAAPCPPAAAAGAAQR